MVNHPTHQIRVNLPQPGETKAQFMTRSVRLLLKSGKSKHEAIQIAERVWNNVSQHVTIQPNQTDANVVFSGNSGSSSQAGRGGSISVRQMDSFSQLKAKLDNSQMERQIQNQNQFLQNLQTVITKSLSPLANIQQQANSPNSVVRNYSNGPQNVGSISTRNLEGVMRQSVRIQEQMLQTLGLINKTLQTSVQELTAIRSTGLKVRRANVKAKQPIYSDYWKSETANTRLNGKTGNFLETFISNIAGDAPGLAKAFSIVRNVVNPVQFVRKKVGSTVRNKIDSFRKLTDDLNYKYSDDREQLKKDAGLLVLNSDQLNNQVITKIVPDKLGEIVDADKEKIDILRNIYRVNAELANYLTKGKVNTQFQNTINKERTVFDADVGQYFTESEHQTFTQSRLNQIRKFLSNTKKNRRSDPLFRMAERVNSTLNKFSKKQFGTSGVLSDDELLNAISAGYDPDSNQYSLAHREQKYVDNLYNVLNKNEIRGARRFGPESISGATFGKISDFNKTTIVDEFKNGPINAIVGLDENGNPIVRQLNLSDLSDDMKYMTRKDGSYITDKFGKRKLRWAKHDINGNLDLRKNARFSSDDLVFDDGKESTYNPIQITKDIFKEFKNYLRPFTTSIHENIDSDSNFVLRFLKKITPNIKQSEEKVYNVAPLDLSPISKSKSRFGLTSGSIIGSNPSLFSRPSRSASQKPSFFGNTTDIYKSFVVNHPSKPLYVIDPALIELIKTIGIGSGVNVGNVPGLSSSSAITSVGFELDQERKEREQESRDDVQKQLNNNIDRLNDLLENGGLTVGKQTVVQDTKEEDNIFKALLGGLFGSLGKLAIGGAGALLSSLGITGMIGGLAAGVVALIKGSLGLLFSGISSALGSILSGFGKSLLGKAGLLGVGWALLDKLNNNFFKVKSKTENQTTEEWQNENSEPLSKMGVTATGLISGGQYLKNKLGPTENVKLNDKYKDNLEVERVKKANRINNTPYDQLSDSEKAIKTRLEAEGVDKGAKNVDLSTSEKAKVARDTIKSTSKTIGKNIVRGVAKKLPILGFLMSSYAALERVKAGDYTGAVTQIGSGLLATIPGVGTAASLLVDAGLAVRDHRDQSEKPKPENAKETKSENPVIETKDKDIRKPGNYITVKVTPTQWEDLHNQWISTFGQPTHRYSDGSVSYTIPENMKHLIPTYPSSYKMAVSDHSGTSKTSAVTNIPEDIVINSVPNSQVTKFHSGGLIEGNPGSEVPIVAKPGEYVLNQTETKTISSYLSDISKWLRKMKEMVEFSFEKIQKPLSKTFIKELEDKGSFSEVLTDSVYGSSKNDNKLADALKEADVGKKSEGSSDSASGSSSKSNSFLQNIGNIVNADRIKAAMAEKMEIERKKNAIDMNPKHFKIGDKRIGAIEASRLNTQFYNQDRYNIVGSPAVMTKEQVARRYNLSEEDLKKENAYTLYYNSVGGNDNLANVKQKNVFTKQQQIQGYSFQEGNQNGSSSSTLPGVISGNGPAPAITGLGSISSKYESGASSARIGYDKKGGTSYGRYQLASNRGSYKDFLEYLDKQGGDAAGFAAKLRAAGPGNTGSRQGAAPDVWREFAKANPEQLHKWEHAFIKKSHYEGAYAQIKDPALREAISSSPALQEALWSTAVQHGPTGGSNLFKKSWADSNNDKEQFVKNLYRRRGGQFGDHDPGVKKGVANRFVNEGNDILAALKAEQNKQTVGDPNSNIETLHAELNQTKNAIEEQKAQTAENVSKSNVATQQNKQIAANNVQPPVIPVNNNVINNGAFTAPSSPSSSGGAAAQQGGIRSLDGNTQKIVNDVFNSTVTNFSQGATNYAIGSTPMSVTHI